MPTSCDLGHIFLSTAATGWTVTVLYGRQRSYAVAGVRAGDICAEPVAVAQWWAGEEGVPKAPGQRSRSADTNRDHLTCGMNPHHWGFTPDYTEHLAIRSAVNLTAINFAEAYRRCQ
jgi:hypothetical protein